MKCKYCSKEATRNHARHDTGKCEDLCEDYYAIWEKEEAYSTQ